MLQVYLLAVRILKQLKTFSFTAKITIVQGNPSFKRYIKQKIHQISYNISEQSDPTIIKILQFGDTKLDFETNKFLLMSSTEFILSPERFSCLLIE